MKRILFILITIPLIFNSCEKEDDSVSNNTSGSIIGTWELEDYTITETDGYIDPVFLTETVIETETQTMSTHPINYLFWVFRDDGTFSEYHYDIDSLMRYYHRDYEKNGNEINIIDDGNNGDIGYIMTYPLTSLTNSNLNTNGEYYHEDTEFDTTSFNRTSFVFQFIKSQLPDFTTELLNKKKPVSGYNSFLNRRENR
tara:strand:- start:461 stop:1054 length:594 start_codon:yes stop_codon:yes gene_type:complete